MGMFKMAGCLQTTTFVTRIKTYNLLSQVSRSTIYPSNRAAPSGMDASSRTSIRSKICLPILLCIFLFVSSLSVFAQDWVKTGTSLGAEKIRLAATDFKASTQDPKNADLQKT